VSLAPLLNGKAGREAGPIRIGPDDQRNSQAYAQFALFRGR
jgi:hypothetical protein